MAIGTGLAILGGALIGGAASLGAAGKAADAATNAADKNAQVARDIYDQNKRLFEPLITGSYPAMGRLQQRLGLGGGGGINTAFGAQGGGGGSALQGGADWNEYLSRYTDVQAEFDKLNATPEGRAALEARGTPTAQAFAARHYQDHGTRPDENRTVKMLPSEPSGGAEGEDLAYGEPGGLVEPVFGPRAMAERPAMSALDLSAERYRKSPGYDYKVKEAGRGVNSGFAAGGMLQSGAAATAFGQKMMDLADQDYYDWADRERAQWNADRDFQNRNFDIDMSRSDARYDSDRGFTYGRFIDDRNYGTQRFDKETSDLFGLLGIGTGAAGALSGAGANYGSSVMGSNNQAASATGSAAIAGANSVNNLIGQGLQAWGMFGGGGVGRSVFNPGGGATPPISKSYGYTGGGMGGLY